MTIFIYQTTNPEVLRTVYDQILKEGLTSIIYQIKSLKHQETLEMFNLLFPRFPMDLFEPTMTELKNSLIAFFIDFAQLYEIEPDC